MSATSRLLVIVPTRNRASLAAAAVRSVLEAPTQRVRVLVSDNSNDGAERDLLERECAALQDARLACITPPEPLAMGPHWEWALATALEEDDWTHVAILTDRMLFLPGAIDDLLALAERWPERTLAFGMNRIADATETITLEQSDWTGRIVEIPSAALLEASANSVFVGALPRLLNTSVPRALLGRIADAYGSVCDSVAPDFRFCYRSLAVTDTLVYYDRMLLLQYALSRSNGFSHSRGVVTQDSQDFQRELLERGVQFATPVPGFCTVVNTIVHEYCSVRAETPGGPLPPLDVDAFFGALTREIDAMEPGEIQSALREEIGRVMAEQGATAAPLTMAGGPESPVRRLTRTVSRASRRQDALGATLRLLTGWFRNRYVLRATEWPDLAAAIRRAREAPRPPRSGKSKHEIVLRDVTVLSRHLRA